MRICREFENWRALRALSGKFCGKNRAIRKVFAFCDSDADDDSGDKETFHLCECGLRTREKVKRQGRPVDAISTADNFRLLCGCGYNFEGKEKNDGDSGDDDDD